MRAGSLATSALVLMVAGTLIYKGVQFIRFYPVQAAVKAIDSGPTDDPVQMRELLALRQAAWKWRDVYGLRDLARQSIRTIDFRLPLSNEARQPDVANALVVEPMESFGWTLLASTDPDGPNNGQSLFDKALEMATVVGPYEQAALLNRLNLTIRFWSTVSAEQKYRFASDIKTMLRSRSPALVPWWDRIKDHIAPDIRDDIRVQIKSLSPQWRW